jgi:hypothetical protein
MTRPRPRLEYFHRKAKLPEVRVAGDINAVQFEEKEQLKALLRRNTDQRVIRESLAAVNANAAQRSVGISQECVTGFLLPSGAVEIGPHGITDQEAYLPSFVIKEFMKHGIVGFMPEYDEHGTPLPPRWVGMTARIQGVKADAIVGVIHALRNVGEPIRDGIGRKDTAMFWKVAGPNEPKSYTFTNIHGKPANAEQEMKHLS